MERVTDDQYALINGKIRHCPRGVDQFFELLEEAHRQDEQALSSSAAADAPSNVPAAALSNKERRESKKRFDAVQRRLDKLRSEPDRIDQELSQRLLDLQNEKASVEAEISSLEDEWLELADLLGID